MNKLSNIPSVERVLQHKKSIELISHFGRSLVLDEIRLQMADLRERVQKGASIPEIDSILENVSLSLTNLEKSSLQPVINATGVVLHTNLGRAPL